MAGGVGVDSDEMYTAAIMVRRAVDHGTREDSCHLWSFDYGHEALATAAQAFLSDADRALDGLHTAGVTIADGLTTQAGAYREADTRVRERFAALGGGAPSSGPALGTRRS